MDFKGKKALVTGGGRGLGAAICEKFASEGAAVAVLDVAREAAEECADRINRDGGRALAHVCDISDAGQAAAAADRVKAEFGGLDILVNNAGILAAGKLADAKESDFDRMVSVNLKGTFLMTRAMLPLLRESGRGAIVNLSSTFAFDHVSNFGLYSATKAAIASMTVTWSKEEARYGIRANAVAPGSIDTEMNKGLKEDPQMLERVHKLTPLRRLGLPGEVAAAVAYLASEDASYVTGQVLRVSGGYVNPY